jgi:hypothetical protein
MAKGLIWSDLLAIGFVVLLFAPLWLGELISGLGSYRQQVRRARALLHEPELRRILPGAA